MNVLYVKASPKPEETSFSQSVARVALHSIAHTHPTYTIETYDLYDGPSPEINNDVLEGWESLQSGTSFSDLNNRQKESIQAMNFALEKFLRADRIVIASPMWNFGSPPRLKTFLDCIVIAGRTFKYTEKGPTGLVTGKKVLHIISSGGIYSHGQGASIAFSQKHTEAVFGFLGVTDVKTVWVEGVAMVPRDQMDAIKQAAIQQVHALLPDFLA